MQISAFYIFCCLTDSLLFHQFVHLSNFLRVHIINSHEMHFDFASLISVVTFVTIFTDAFLIVNTQKDRPHDIRVFLRIHL